MGAFKSLLMDEEEKLWDDIANVIGECEHVSEVSAKATAMAKQRQLWGYLDAETIEENVSELWNEFWSNYP